MPGDSTSQQDNCTSVAEELRCEYQAIAQFLTATLAVRFTTLGFFAATAGFIFQCSSLEGNIRGPVILCLTIVVWLIEVKNRIILAKYRNRGEDIEKIWRSRCGTCFDKPFFHRAHDYPVVHFLWLGVKFPASARLKRIISHSVAIDILMLSALVAAVASMCG
jgi:hypothetical protein